MVFFVSFVLGCNKQEPLLIHVSTSSEEAQEYLSKELEKDINEYKRHFCCVDENGLVDYDMMYYVIPFEDYEKLVKNMPSYHNVGCHNCQHLLSIVETSTGDLREVLDHANEFMC